MQDKKDSSFLNSLWIILTILIVFFAMFLIQEKAITGRVSENSEVKLVNNCGNETILYNFGELCWQKYQMPESADNWTDAYDYCKNLILANHTNWRLPTLKESWDIRKEIETGNFLLNETHFWTATSHEFKTSHKYIDFRINYKDYAPDFRSGYGVKCVRENIEIFD